MSIFPFLFPQEWVALLCHHMRMEHYVENNDVFAQFAFARFALVVYELGIIAYYNGTLWFWQMVFYYAMSLQATITVFERIKMYRTDPKYAPGKIVVWCIGENSVPSILTIVFVGKFIQPHAILQVTNIACSVGLIFWLNHAWKWKVPKKD
ncbi:MAG: hypothetical protein CMP20_09350 [Rickettsiales bacterium]|nr:hypothetical protein [Rickettsiales bacterium]